MLDYDRLTVAIEKGNVRPDVQRGFLVWRIQDDDHEVLVDQNGLEILDLSDNGTLVPYSAATNESRGSAADNPMHGSQALQGLNDSDAARQPFLEAMRNACGDAIDTFQKKVVSDLLSQLKREMLPYACRGSSPYYRVRNWPQRAFDVGLVDVRAKSGWGSELRMPFEADRTIATEEDRSKAAKTFVDAILENARKHQTSSDGLVVFVAVDHRIPHDVLSMVWGVRTGQTPETVLAIHGDRGVMSTLELWCFRSGKNPMGVEKVVGVVVLRALHTTCASVKFYSCNGRNGPDLFQSWSQGHAIGKTVCSTWLNRG